MKDFNSYEKKEEKAEGEGDISDLAQRLTAAFAGKGEGDILRAIYAEAEKSVRAGIAHIPFTLHAPDGDLTPDIVYTDDLSSLLRHAGKGETHAVPGRR